ncbi:MAG TPA: CrcB family protein [Bifidobacterium pullorum]|nr:CrcB family protein [Bifidobacterium pullorum]
MTALLVCLCGGLGATARFVLNTSIQRWWNRSFPLATFIINVIATFCAGMAASAYANMVVEQPTYLLFVTGFLGGFSTFSTAINEIVSLARSGKFATAGWYLLATIVVPVICVALGWMVGGLGR